jgi:hypothetical protein
MSNTHQKVYFSVCFCKHSSDRKCIRCLETMYFCGMSNSKWVETEPQWLRHLWLSHFFFFKRVESLSLITTKKFCLNLFNLLLSHYTPDRKYFYNCIIYRFFSFQWLHMREKMREMNTEQKRIDKNERIWRVADIIMVTPSLLGTRNSLRRN